MIMSDVDRNWNVPISKATNRLPRRVEAALDCKGGIVAVLPEQSDYPNPPTCSQRQVEQFLCYIFWHGAGNDIGSPNSLTVTTHSPTHVLLSTLFSCEGKKAAVPLFEILIENGHVDTLVISFMRLSTAPAVWSCVAILFDCLWCSVIGYPKTVIKFSIEWKNCFDSQAKLWGAVIFCVTGLLYTASHYQG